jgi:uncharacterized protein
MADESINQQPGAAGLEALISRAVEASGRAEGDTGRSLPPVDRWNPDICGAIDMEIRADGTWFYNKTPIARERLVRLFSTVLRKDEDGVTYLVTPVEKLAIRVADAPFLAVEMNRSLRGGEPVISFRTNVGDVVEIGPEHGLRFDIVGSRDQLKPYIHVRGRLEALVSRAVTHELVAHGENLEVDGVPMFALRSAGCVFPIMPLADLERATDMANRG